MQSIAPARAPAAPHGARRGAHRRRPSSCRSRCRSSAGPSSATLQDIFYGEVMKPRVYGRAHIPHNRNVIVVANHASHLDMGFVRHALGKYGEDIVSLAAQDYFFDERASSAPSSRTSPTSCAIDRKASLRQAIRQASEVIEQGKTVLIFPEGTRSRRRRDPGVQAARRAPRAGARRRHPAGVPGRHARGDAEGRGPVPTRRDMLARIGPPLVRRRPAPPDRRA